MKITLLDSWGPTLDTDIKAATKFYLDRLGVNKEVQSKLTIRIRKYDSDEDHGETESLSRKQPQRVFRVSINRRLADPLHILAHEMVHVKQYALGELHYNYDDEDYDFHWKGHKRRFPKHRDEWDLYFDSPWEIEAAGKARGLYMRYLFTKGDQHMADDLKHTHTAQLIQFNRTFNYPIPTEPTLMTRKEFEFRMTIFLEELCELYDAFDAGDVVAFADALGDMNYINYGTAVESGIDLDTTFDEIHNSNMTKVGEDGLPIYREDGKLMKGPNYRKPNLPPIMALNIKYPSTGE